MAPANQFGDFIRRLFQPAASQQSANPLQRYLQSDFSGRLNDYLVGLGQGRTPSESLARGAAYVTQQDELRQQRNRSGELANRTVDFLKNQGYSDQDATVISQYPAMVRDIISMMQAQQPSPEEYGLQTITAVDDQGKPRLLQVSKTGRAKATELPEGLSLSKEPIRFDAGTHYVLLDPVTRQEISKIPKETEQQAIERSRGSQIGSAEGQIKVSAPEALDRSQQILDNIDHLLSDDSGLSEITGRFNQFKSGVVLSDRGRESLEILGQLNDQGFLQMFDRLRGAGAISDAEGRVARNAFARLSRSQSTSSIKRSLREVRKIVERGMNRSGELANSPISAGSTSSNDYNWRVIE